MKEYIKNFSLDEVESVFTHIGEKRYRAKQLFNWLYERNVDDFWSMTNFSKSLRKILDEQYEVSPLTFVDRKKSNTDGTEKFLFKTYDEHYIEAVFIRNDGTDEGRLTVCVSSQIGCPLGCAFCQTSKIGFKRNLQCAEILDQINQIRRMVGLKNNNVVFMGMGEPFLNYEAVLKSADIMNYTFGFHISARKITLSTSGVYEGIERFIDEKRPYNLAISLNDTEMAKRSKYMPIEKKYPMKTIVQLLEHKFPASRNRLTIEYVMRKDNISQDDAQRLKTMFRYNRIKLNLITLNKGGHSLEVPTEEEVNKFIKRLEIMNIPISIRKSAGNDIDGACGQLSGKYYVHL